MKFVKVMFLHLSVILFTGGWVSRPRPRGEVGGSGQVGFLGPDPRGRLGGLAGGEGGIQAQAMGGIQAHTLGVSRPTRPRGCPHPHPGVVQPHTWGSRPRGCIPACTEADTPQFTN